MPQTVSAHGGLSLAGAVWHILEIQALALSHGCALLCREPFLLVKLPRCLWPRISARVAPQRGLHVTWPVPHVYSVRSVGMGSRSRHGRRGMAARVTSACGDVHDHASPARAI